MSQRSLPLLLLPLLAVVACDGGPWAPEAPAEAVSAPTAADGWASGVDSDDADSDDTDSDAPPAGPTFGEVVRKGGAALGRFGGQPPRGPSLATATIGPEGGTVALGSWEVVVPAGAVDRTTLFMIRRPRGGRAQDFVLVELRPHAMKSFAVPVTVRMPLAGTSLEGDPHAVIVSWDEATESWSPVATSVIEGGARLEARVLHFSYWGTSFRRAELSSGGQ